MATRSNCDSIDIEKQFESITRYDVEGLRELRRIAGKGQADIASVMQINQPAVSKSEKQADMYISTLRSYVEALGGELELTVRLPKRPVLRIHHLGDAPSAMPAKLHVKEESDSLSPRQRHG